MQSIDLENPGVLKDFDIIFMGIMTKQYARGSDTIGSSEYKKFQKEVRASFIKCVKYLEVCMSVLKNDVFKS